MLATLDASLSRAHSRRQLATEPSKAASYGGDLGSISDNYGSDIQYQAENESRYQHNTGTFWTASRVIVHRLCQQPFMLARRTRRPTDRSLDNQVRNGFLPQGSLPTWLTDTARLEIVDTHPLLRALRDPNAAMTQFNASEMIGGSLLVTGRGYNVALPSQREGRTWDLWPVPSTWMHRDRQNKGRWTIKPPGASGNGIPCDDSQVAQCYFADPSNPACAISPLAQLAKSVLNDEAIKGAQQSEFKNPLPKVALIAGDVMGETSFTDDPNRVSSARPVRLEPFQKRQIQTWFQQQYGGAQKYGLPVILDAVIRDLKILSRKPDEMAFQESAALTKEQIFAGLGVSELLTGKLEGISRASGALAEQFAVDYCLNAILMCIGQAFTKTLCPLFAASETEELACWLAPVVPRDTELFIELCKQMRLTYSMTRNEWRALFSQETGRRLPRVDGFDDVVMPQTLDERDEPLLGIGRDETDGMKSRLVLPSLNGRH